MSGQTVRFYEFDPFSVDVLSRVLLRDGKALPLEPKLFDTLLVLVENHGRVVSKEELMKAVWGPDTFVEEGSLARNISLLRKTLAEGLGDTQCIATFPKRGYQFVATVREVATSRSEEGVEGHGQGGEEADGGHPQGAPLRSGLAELLRRHPVAVVGGCAGVLALALGYWFVRPLPAPTVRGHQALTHDGREKRGPLLTDGPRLYFEEKVDGKWVLAVVPSAGGSVSIPLPSSDVVISDIAHDGSDLIGWQEIPGTASGGLLIWPVAGGAPESLGGLQGEWPTWSPQGTRIAYGDGIHSLFVAGGRGENPNKVASVEGHPQWLRWSPDGRSLRFQQLDPRSERSVIWEVAVGGGKPHPLLTGWKYPVGDLVWAPERSYSLFDSGPAGGEDIWARREDCNPFCWCCRESIRIVSGIGGYRYPLPSRDGKKLFVIDGQYKKELARYDMKSRTFVPYLPSVLAGDLDFSPDGKRLAYVRLPERTLWRSRADGSEATPLTVSGSEEAYSPHWSPDGKQIAYMSISAQKRYKACVVPADGGQHEQLIPGAGEEGIPTWFRDGNFLVFGDVLHGRPASEMTIHLLDLRTHQLRTLPGSKGLWTPRWSPNGRYIAALALGDEAKGQRLVYCPALLVYDFKTRRWTRLDKAKEACNLAWSRDSQYVYFHTASPDLGLYRAHVLSKKVERLASLGGFAAMNDDWIGVAPDGSPLVMKDTYIDEVYALDVQWP
jgi:DNA-binding winged helix-turn-helix (wHTH) protein/Tol biopolymer transport system component